MKKRARTRGRRSMAARAARAAGAALAVRAHPAYTRTVAEIVALLYIVCLAGYDVRPWLRYLGVPVAATSACCSAPREALDASTTLAGRNAP